MNKKKWLNIVAAIAIPLGLVIIAFCGTHASAQEPTPPSVPEGWEAVNPERGWIVRPKEEPESETPVAIATAPITFTPVTTLYFPLMGKNFPWRPEWWNDVNGSTEVSLFWQYYDPSTEEIFDYFRLQESVDEGQTWQEIQFVGHNWVDLIRPFGTFWFRVRGEWDDGPPSAWSDTLVWRVFWQDNANYLELSGSETGGKLTVRMEEGPWSGLWTRVWFAAGEGARIDEVPHGSQPFQYQMMSGWYRDVRPADAVDFHVHWTVVDPQAWAPVLFFHTASSPTQADLASVELEDTYGTSFPDWCPCPP
ncbi:MAG TPA: hypothetical protein VMW41_00990 [Candidatus Bathyarchaeia archaeon]|nr:hypothetical protein [Candidatus Bathyarchaeia archaeon]